MVCRESRAGPTTISCLAPTVLRTKGSGFRIEDLGLGLLGFRAYAASSLKVTRPDLELRIPYAEAEQKSG